MNGGKRTFRYINVPWLEMHGLNHLSIPAAVAVVLYRIHVYISYKEACASEFGLLLDLATLSTTKYGMPFSCNHICVCMCVGVSVCVHVWAVV